MRNDLTEVLFIIDKSGSMSGLEKDTIGGFNSMLEKQKEQPGEVLVTTVFFDSEAKLMHDRVNLAEVKPLTKKDYCASGCTALLDAVGTYVKRLHKAQKAMDEAAKPAHTLVVIITDGEENSSLEYSYKDVKKLLDKQQQKHGWDIIYLGANLDVAKEASRLGISANCAMEYDYSSKGVRDNLDMCVCACVSEVRRGRKASLK